MEDVVKALLEQNAMLTQQIIDLAKEVLHSSVPAPTPTVPMETVPYFPAMSETEEDLEFALATGQINEEEYKDRKKELEFLHAPVVVPLSS